MSNVHSSFLENCKYYIQCGNCSRWADPAWMMPASVDPESTPLCPSCYEPLKRGKVHPPNTLFMSVHVGTATREDGGEYDLASSLGGSPIVYNKQSQRWYSLGWQDILKMAVEAGLDETEREDEKAGDTSMGQSKENEESNP